MNKTQLTQIKNLTKVLENTLDLNFEMMLKSVELANLVNTYFISMKLHEDELLLFWSEDLGLFELINTEDDYTVTTFENTKNGIAEMKEILSDINAVGVENFC